MPRVGESTFTAIFCICQYVINVKIYFAVAPYIDRKNLQKKVVRSGQLLRIEADVKGEPPPTVTWALKDVVLKSQDR